MAIEKEKSCIDDIKTIIREGLTNAYNAVGRQMLDVYWHIGRRIVEEEQNGNARADYGSRLLSILSEEISKEFGSNYSAKNLRYYRKFYLSFNDIEIWNARVPNLKWTHFRSLLRVDDEDARRWYMLEASKENWSSRTLDRNIGSQYYYRLLQSPQKEAVEAEMKASTAEYQKDSSEFIKSPYVAEFLGLQNNLSFTERELENSILSHLQQFLMELGRGFSFVARQKHIATDAGDFFIDLVFYNFNLKCFVLIDLKTKQITHQDVGQMDMYVRMYDEQYLPEGHNPTLGIVLCSETSRDIAKYSILHDNKQLFAAKYLTYLPTPEKLQDEIERQKQLFLMQNPDKTE